MAIFAIGDLHLSLGVDKPMNVFGGWENYTVRLEENWRKIVCDEDTVVLAGDISWAMKLDDAKEDFAFIQSLPGRKIILKGNHDYWWSTKAKLQAFFVSNGFTSIEILFNNALVVEDVGICGTRGWILDDDKENSELVFSRELGRLKTSADALEQLPCSRRIAFLHYPPIYRNLYVEDMIDIMVAANVTHCYYGHLHSASIQYAYRGAYRGIRFDLISADALNFVPYKLDI